LQSGFTLRGVQPAPRSALRRLPRPAALLLAALTGCAPATFPRDTTFAELPGWATDRHGEAIPALRLSCQAIGRLPPERNQAPVRLGPACQALETLPPGDPAARAFLERHFRPVALGSGTLTGYFEPELRGAPTPSSIFATPLHARPPELVEADLGAFVPELRGRRVAGQVREGRLVPYHDRAAIAAGALDGRGLELAWVDDPADAFFLQVQGSGRVRMIDGSVLRLGYAGTNGYPYFAIGRTLVERGVLTREQVSLQAIRAWMAGAGPEAAAELMARNPSYVFFAPRPELPPDVGPVGTLGVPLTPGRSIAVDRQATPLGLPVWIAGRDPITGGPLRRLTVAQDTGGAIRGPARADLFTGWGPDAAERAGRMREEAQLFLLVPR
jgi:membrane-bound lytic murein transglycosylase A